MKAFVSAISCIQLGIAAAQTPPLVKEGTTHFHPEHTTGEAGFRRARKSCVPPPSSRTSRRWDFNGCATSPAARPPSARCCRDSPRSPRRNRAGSWLASLEALNPQRVVPAHGELADASVIGEYRDYLRALERI
jgi:hypothetical protein